MSTETGQIYIFDLAAEKLLSTYSSHAMAVRSFAWSYDSQVRATVLIILPASHCSRCLRAAYSYSSPHQRINV